MASLGRSPESSSVACRCGAHLRPKLQDKQTGLFLRKVYLSPFLAVPWGCWQPRTVSYYSPVGPRDMSWAVHRSQKSTPGWQPPHWEILALGGVAEES